MATASSEVRDELKKRLRVTTQSISDANNYLVMNRVQQTLNYTLAYKVTTGTLTEVTGTCLYYTSTSIASDCMKVLSMHEAGASRSVMPVDWRSFWHYDRNWLYSTLSPATTTATGRVEAWSHIGNNMIAIYPGASGTVSCVYLQNTTTINASGEDFSFDDHDMDPIYDLCEIVWHLHLRNYAELKNKIEMFSKTIAPYIGGE